MGAMMEALALIHIVHTTNNGEDRDEQPVDDITENTETNDDRNNQAVVHIEEIHESVPNEMPDCRVCYETYKTGDQIYQCSEGHSICGECRKQIIRCPFCRGRINGRCRD